MQQQAITGFVPSMFREVNNARSQSQGAEPKSSNDPDQNQNFPLNEQKQTITQPQKKNTMVSGDKTEGKDGNLLTADVSLISTAPVQGTKLFKFC